MRTKLLVSALCVLTFGLFALPSLWGIVAIAPPPPLPPGIAAPKPSATPFDPDSGEEDSEESNADESSPAPTEPKEEGSTDGKL
ncbi:MAG TPA: hypothetical protein VNP98_02850 [Chthoniobacterales bacterium]|nr:hypothetical protein [Chthoniobacterales bacterium]